MISGNELEMIISENEEIKKDAEWIISELLPWISSSWAKETLEIFLTAKIDVGRKFLLDYTIPAPHKDAFSLLDSLNALWNVRFPWAPRFFLAAQAAYSIAVTVSPALFITTVANFKSHVSVDADTFAMKYLVPGNDIRMFWSLFSVNDSRKIKFALDMQKFIRMKIGSGSGFAKCGYDYSEILDYAKSGANDHEEFLILNSTEVSAKNIPKFFRKVLLEEVPLDEIKF